MFISFLLIFIVFINTAWNTLIRGDRLRANNQPYIMIFIDDNTYDDDDRLKQYFAAVEESLLM